MPYKYFIYDKELEIENEVDERYISQAMKFLGKNLSYLFRLGQVDTHRKIYKAVKVKE